MKDWTSKTGDARILHGSCLERLRDLLEGSVQCCVTSPPYWGLRDYGHSNQLGLEPTPEAYVAKMVAVFCEVRRVLREDGVLWLNLGDSYFGGGYSNHDINGESWKDRMNGDKRSSRQQDIKRSNPGIKPKDLVGIPWRVAFALQADGWWLRQDIIWHKPNPMPESVKDRCTKAHEYIFLLTKSPRYFYDSEAVKESSVDSESLEGYRKRGERRTVAADADQFRTRVGFEKLEGKTYPTRNRRSVWTVSTKPYSGAHFATYPPDLIEPCILAGTSERGRCRACGAPWERVVEDTGERVQQHYAPGTQSAIYKADGHAKKPSANSVLDTGFTRVMKTTGWQPTCQCNAGEPVPCLVLDPFNGSGTTGEVCIKHGRHYVGCELNQDYIELAKKRLQAAARSYGMPLLDTATT